MSTKWCPNCHAEYREGFVVCADCGVDLVESRPPSAATHWSAEPQQPDAPFLPGDHVVELATFAIVEAELVAAQLRVAGIPAAVLGVGAVVHTGVRRARLMVRESDLADAEQFVEQLSTEERTGMPIADADLAALAEESTGGTDPATGAAV
jgi:hypothetical protein